MAAFTPLADADLARLAGYYALPCTPFARGIAEGIENSNYLLECPGGQPSGRKWVLTILEFPDAVDIDFQVRLSQRLQDSEVPVAVPVPGTDGGPTVPIGGKPALLYPFMEGRHPTAPEPAQCAALGTVLARTHLAARDLSHPNRRDWAWLQQAAASVTASLTAEEAGLLREEISHQSALEAQVNALPSGIIHGDLFRDNALFQGQRVTAIIDWYNAGSGPLLYDLAITLNDWCLDDAGEMDAGLAGSLLGGYARVRPVSPDERRLLADLLRRAALRFWVSRLHSRVYPPVAGAGGTLYSEKNPDAFRNRLDGLRAMTVAGAERLAAHLDAAGGTGSG